MGAMRLAWALAGAWLWLVASARAQSPDDLARGHFEAGSGYLEQGDHERALREFERAHELSPQPELLYHLYVVHERLGHVAQAAGFLKEYLASGADLSERDALGARLSDLERRLEPAPEPAPEPALPAPPAAPPPVEPVAQREPARAVEPGGERSERFTEALASFGVAGAGAITFAVAGGLALQEDRDVAARCGRDAGRSCADGELRALRTRSTVADIGLGVMVAGAVVGATLLWLDRRAARSRAGALLPGASFGARGGSVVLEGRF